MIRSLLLIPSLTLALPLAFSLAGAPSLAASLQLRVTLESTAPDGGVFLTPVWVGFHDGSFDSYDGGTVAPVEIERISEDGNIQPISDAFGANQTLVPTGSTQTGTRVQGALGGAPIGPGGSASARFEVDTTGANRFFSYASMVLPTNDFFVANGSAVAHDLSGLTAIGDVLQFAIGTSGTVNDAGTELNDFAFTAGNGLFPGLGGGQSGPNEGTDEGAVIANVGGSPFAAFANTNPAFDLSPFDFNDSALYPNGIATLRFQVVPEPALGALLGLAGLGILRRLKR